MDRVITNKEIALQLTTVLVQSTKETDFTTDSVFEIYTTFLNKLEDLPKKPLVQTFQKDSHMVDYNPLENL